MTTGMIAERIRQALPEAWVEVESEDGVHFTARVVSAAFEGQGMVARHRMVYQALGPELGREIHALQLTTLTPGEWQGRVSEGTH
ncbi:MAG: BolA family transcriptional regulator [Hydrogenophilus sp.]|nr:BolA family transcriptional regulator [Hydrogenophilus sp.]